MTSGKDQKEKHSPGGASSFNPSHQQMSAFTSEEQFRHTLDNMLEGCQIIGFDWRYLYVNNAAARYGRQAKEELLGHTVMEKYPGIEDTELFALMQQCMEKRITRSAEFEFTYPDGNTRWFQFSIQPEPKGIFILTLDITDRKKAEMASQDSESRLYGIIASAMDAIISIDETQRVVLFNAAAEIMFGYRAADMIGQLLDRLIPERFRQAHREHINVFGRSGITNRSMGSLGAIIGVRANGEEFPIEASISQIEVAGAKLYTVILRDITPRKQMEDALQDSERRFRLLVEGVKEYAILMLDPGGHVVSWNEGARRIKGYEAEDVLGKHISIFYTAEDKAEELLHMAVKQGSIEDEGWRVRQDGSKIWAYVSISALHDERGQLLGFAKITRDLTDRKEAETQIRRLNRELESRVRERTLQLEVANKELEAFAYSVSHDLRAPLRALSGFSRILIQDYHHILDEGGQHYLHRIRENARQMGALIDDLLKFSRLIREPVKREMVNVTAVVHQVLADLHLKPADFPLDVVIDELPDCLADRQLLYQVYLNLIENAVKYSRQRDVMRIHVGVQELASTAVTRSQPVYFVRDNGVGFDMAYADKIFRVFQRLHRAEEYEGTGVGLALVQRIIHRHSGQIWVEAVVDQGATFFFTIGLPPEEIME